jgi:NIPSNAP
MLTGCCPVVELRQYTLRPGQREVLLELFDRALVESQEAVGMQIVGQYRDLDRPDRFVWLRGFPGMEQRRASLEAFYGGPVWREHAAAANATMVDVDDVLLLRPAAPTSGFAPLIAPRPDGDGADGADGTDGVVLVTICALDAPASPANLARLLPALAAMDAPLLACFVEETGENTFPALPVRAGEHVVVWLQHGDSDPRSQAEVLETSAKVGTAMLSELAAPPTALRLHPTPRSKLR